MKRNCALYFGSFNPLHIGHITIAKYVLLQEDIDSLKFVLSPQSPLKEDAGNSSERFQTLQSSIELLNNGNFDFIIDREMFNSTEDEIKSVEILSKPIPPTKKFEISDIEFHLPKPLYTYNTLEELQKLYPNDNFVIIMGADNLSIIDKWYKGDEILKKYKIRVYPREGFNTEELCKKYGATYLDAPQINISSTQIRENSL